MNGDHFNTQETSFQSDMQFGNKANIFPTVKKHHDTKFFDLNLLLTVTNARFTRAGVRVAMQRD